jgi:hypothetical protein
MKTLEKIMKNLSKSDIDRFQSKFIVTPGCWIWTAGKHNFGYGQISFGVGVNISASRFSYRFYIGPIPDGMFICHKCDNPSCVNPAHLFSGMPKENTEDMWSKGRGVKCFGEKQGNSKLTEDKVREIRAWTGKQRIIAEKFGVTQSLVSYIKSGKSWPHI